MVTFHNESTGLNTVHYFEEKKAIIQIYSCVIRNIKIKKNRVAILSLKSLSNLIGNTFILISGNLSPFSHFTVGEQKGCFCLIYSV